MPHKKKILLIDNSIEVTGAFNAICQTATDLSAEYEFIFVIPSESNNNTSLDQRAFRYYKIPFIEISKRFSALLLYIPYLVINSIKTNRILKRENISLIHVNDIYNLVPWFIKTFLNKNIKIVVHSRFMPDRYNSGISSLWKKLYLNKSSYVICVSQAAASGFTHDKVHVIYDRPPLTEQLPYAFEQLLQEQPIRCIYLANYTGGKGHLSALESIKKARTISGIDLRIDFYGSTFNLSKNEELKNILISKIEQEQLSQIAIVHGVTHQIEEKLKQHHIFLNLSESESFSFTCLEALYYGTPCISSKSGGPQELLQGGEYGLLVDINNTDQAADALIQLAKDKNLRAQFSIKGRSYSRSAFTIENTSGKTAALYRNLL